MMTPAVWTTTHYVDAVNEIDSGHMATSSAWKTVAKVN